MKKILSAVLCLLPLSTVFAQPIHHPDTVTGMPDYYYVPLWYNSCNSFRADTASFYETGLRKNDLNGNTPGNVIAREFRVDTSTLVYGMAALVEINPLSHIATPLQDRFAGRLPEYLKLLQGTDPIVFYPWGDSTHASVDVFPHRMTMLDSLRWDTVAPIILRLPKYFLAAHDTDYFYCFAYECWFPTPVAVDSVFYVLGTYNSNLITYEGYANYPTSYFYIHENLSIICDRCRNDIASKVFSVDHFPDQFDFQWHQNDLGGPFFGLFYPIVSPPETR